MKDPSQILIQQTANVQSARQLRFTTLAEITSQKALLKAYIVEAIAIEKSGTSLPMKKAQDFEMPSEIASAMKKITGLTPAFKKLTPGRQRAYILHFSSAKQVATIKARIERAVPKIFAGKGLNDE